MDLTGQASAGISERWLKAQGIALGCAVLSFAPDGGSPDEQAAVLRQLWPDPRPPKGAAADAYVRWLATFPASTLEALISLRELQTLEWDAHLSFWEQALAMQQAVGPKGTPLIAAARVLADRISRQALSPKQLLRL